MSTKDPFISRFSPNRTNPDVLAKIHVERDDLLKDAVKRVEDGVLTRKRKHLLFVGSRGSGKTHLLSLLVHRLNQNEAVRRKLRIAWLNEDETSLSYADLLVRIFRALVNAYPDEFEGAVLTEAFELGADGAAQFLEAKLVELMTDRKLLVLVENFDALLSSLDEQGQREWRAFLQDSELMVVVATAQRLTEGMTKVNRRKGSRAKKKLISEEKAFFGFFTIEKMSPFGVDEAAELLRRLAHEKGDTDLEEFLASKSGRARVRALHYLSGGNPRLYIVLSEFINKESFDDLVRPFEEMVDERLTPYYQERLRWLSPQQRKLVEMLCQERAPLTVSELAQRVFAAENTVSGQLKKLREMGYVEAVKDRRESFYELKEPLMRLSMQVKDVRDGEPLAILVDFLKVWFEREELEGRLELGGIGELGRKHLESAIEDLKLEGPTLRHSLLRRGVGEIDPENCTVQERGQLYELAEETKNEVDQVVALGAAYAAEDWPQVVKVITTMVDVECFPSEVFSVAMLIRGTAHLDLGNDADAILDLGRSLESSDLPLSQEILARDVRGTLLMDSHRYEEALDEFDHLVAHPAVDGDRKQAAMVAASCAALLIAMNLETANIPSQIIERNFIISEAFVDDLLKKILQGGQNKESWRAFAEHRFALFSRIDRCASFGEGLVRQLGALKSSQLNADGLEDWVALWEDIAGSSQAMKVALRLLRAGVNYLKTGETRELLRLPKEERGLVSEALGLDRQES